MTAVLMTAASCGKAPEISVQEIIEANRTAAILEKCDSFNVKIELAEQDEAVNYFLDGENFLYSDAYIFQLTTDTNQSGMIIGSELNKEQYFKTINLSDEKLDESLRSNCFFDETYSSSEEITDRRSEDGRLVVTTMLSEENTVGFCSGMAELFEGDRLQITYILDAEDYRILQSTEILKGKDGKERQFAKLTTEFDPSAPEMLETLKAHSALEDVCTITLISDIGTDKEQTRTDTVPSGDCIQFYFDGGYDAVYTNEDCTEYFDSLQPVTSDLTLYSKS